MRAASSRVMPLILVIILLGPPGVGKSTQAARLSQAHGIPIVATGELLRAEIARATPLGNEARRAMTEGKLVGDAIVNQLVAARLGAPDGGHGFILDGYPRTLAQARFFDAWLRRRGLPRPTVLELAAPDDVLLARLATRGRADDARDVVIRRLDVYRAEIATLVAYYRDGDYHRIAADRTRDEVFAALEAALPSSSR